MSNYFQTLGENAYFDNNEHILCWIVQTYAGLMEEKLQVFKKKFFLSKLKVIVFCVDHECTPQVPNVSILGTHKKRPRKLHNINHKMPPRC